MLSLLLFGVLVSWVSCSKTDEQIEMPFCMPAYMGPRIHVSDEGQVWMSPFTATRGDKLAMQPIAKLLFTLVRHSTDWAVC